MICLFAHRQHTIIVHIMPYLFEIMDVQILGIMW